VVRFYEDEKKLPQWYYQCVRADLVESEGPNQQIFYFVVHLPWPVTERDSVFRRTKSVDPASGTVTYSATALPKRLPDEKGKIRVQALDSAWHFTPLEGGRTEVRFEQHSDPGGMIPALLVNKLVIQIPFNSLKNMRKMILDTKQ
jgi:hypothetical protein